MKKLNRLLITGAAGGIGTECRHRLRHIAETLRLSDREELGKAAENEEIVTCDLGDKSKVANLVKGCDGILHLGGKSVEGTWEVIRNSNIDGVVNLYEAARKHGKPRIIFASSNHAIGYYRQHERLDSNVTTRPDSLYGVSKVFGEAIASMYHDKFGIETAIVRIGSCFEKPNTHRMLSTWLSFNDFVRLVERVFEIPRLGCPIVYGVSNNDRIWWDNKNVRYLGWQPLDNSEKYCAELDAAMEAPEENHPESEFHGGNFTSDGIHEN